MGDREPHHNQFSRRDDGEKDRFSRATARREEAIWSGGNDAEIVDIYYGLENRPQGNLTLWTEALIAVGYSSFRIHNAWKAQAPALTSGAIFEGHCTDPADTGLPDENCTQV